MINNQTVITDVSFWQDDDNTAYKIDFRVMWSRGIDGTIMRAGQNQWIDEDFQDYLLNAITAGIPWGAYWFYDSRVPPEVQAQKFQEALMGFIPTLGVWADYEEIYGGPWGGAVHFKVFMEELKNRFPGVLIGVYTGPSYWIENTRADQRDYFKQYPLWIAHYGVASPSIPYPWTKEILWQYTDKGDGKYFGVESFGLDMNIFNGDIEDYKRFFGLTSYEPAPEIPQGEEGMYRVWSDTNNMTLRADRFYPAAALETVPRTTVMIADQILPQISGGLAGDSWAHVTSINGVQKNGWVAIKHNGQVLCRYEQVPDTGGGELPTITMVFKAPGYPDLNVEWSPNDSTDNS